MFSKIYINIKQLPGELLPGIKELAQTAGICFKTGKTALEVEFCQRGNGIFIQFQNGKIIVGYGDKTDAFRALGIVKAHLHKPEAVNIRQERRMKKTFIMLDVSRNAVLNTESAVQWLHFMALAGINGLMFYTEDTFEIPGEPLFGYLRGRLSVEEIKKLDDIADSLGIEMIPCIQTLAHFERILVYEKYSDIKDTDSVMLCDSDKTIQFIAKMIKAASVPYRSSRIHIGMDEAWDLGRGNHLNKFGWNQPSEIVTRHLDKVMEILRREKLEPMMWSDMFFRGLPGGEGYYGDELTTETIRKAYGGKVAKDIQLIYWDYYHYDKDFYDGMILKHKAINNRKPIFAPAIHQPRRFWPSAPFTEGTVQAGLKSCFANGIEEMIITIWCDEGTECDCFASLAWVQYIADIIYTGQASISETQRNLKANSGCDFMDFRYAGSMDVLDFLDGKHYPNISRTLLWENPFLGTIQPQLEGESLNLHYQEVAEKLNKMRRKKGNERLELAWRLADILSEKADLPTVIRNAYLKKDYEKLTGLCQNTIPEISRKINELKNYHRTLWLKNYKPFGWEALEARYSTLSGQFEHLLFRLQGFIDNECSSLPELDEKRLKIFTASKAKFPHQLYTNIRDIPSATS